MFFSSLSKREKVIFIITCLIICISIFYRIALEPFIKKWFELDRQISAKQVKLQKYTKLLNEQETINAEYKKYAALGKGSKSDEQHMAGFLSEIEELARKSNVYINTLKPNVAKDRDFYQKLMVEVEIDTNIKDLTRFFYELQNSPNVLKVESMEINAKADQKYPVRSHLFISKIIFQDKPLR